jgi:hypothetical protein
MDTIILEDSVNYAEVRDSDSVGIPEKSEDLDIRPEYMTRQKNLGSVGFRFIAH